MLHPIGPIDVTSFFLRIAVIAALGLAAPAMAASAKHDVLVRATLEDIARAGESPSLTPEAARRMRRDLDSYLRGALASLGHLTSMYGMGTIAPVEPLVYRGKAQKLEQFQATYEHGWIQWRVFVRPDGKIARLIPFSVNAPGT